MPMTAGHAEFALKVRRGQHLAGDNLPGQTRRKGGDGLDDMVGEGLAVRVPAAFQLVGRILDHHRHYIPARARQAAVMQGRDGDFQGRRG